ncbi:MAG: hypothetical protein QOC94_1429 [Actinoplanes sp.]|jgi:hypothetical protein|nr:hypothetical protein [Actinoplanes sp.]
MTSGYPEAPLTTPEQWRDWIADYSEQWFASASEDDIRRADLPSGRLTGPPADPAAVEQAEAELGRRLPPSLRSFYLVTDGMHEAGPWNERVVALRELAWLRDTSVGDVFLMFDLGEEFERLMNDALQIGLREDTGDYWFVDPGDQTGGEWAAYTWHPNDGSEPERYDSFAALMIDVRALR